MFDGDSLPASFTYYSKNEQLLQALDRFKDR
jgi:hypothetical protein